MDGVDSSEEGAPSKQIMVLGATNRPWDLDEALLRRLEKRIYIPLPNEVGRRQLFQINLNKIEISDDVIWETLVASSQGYSGADISSVCRDAAMMPMRRKLLEVRSQGISAAVVDKIKSDLQVPITMADLREALNNVNKSVSNTDLERYQKWMDEYGST